MTNYILETAKKTIAHEIEALQKMSTFIDDTFTKAVKLIHQCKGRIVISGIGKSAIIAQKIVATLNSTGTPALFMHAADAIHGDLGMITEQDIAIVISKSGESPEIKALLPLIKNFGNKTIAICGNKASYLATNADYFLNTTVDSEADPNNLAPTTSTTAQLVMGDCLSVCLLQLKGFKSEDFAKFHPGGALGKKLYLTVGELCEDDKKPYVDISDTISKVIVEISGKRLGSTAVLKNGTVFGMITDGDIRRLLEKAENINAHKAGDICNQNPKCIDASELAINALEILRTNNISQLIVLKDDQYFGIVHLHDLIKAGLI